MKHHFLSLFIFCVGLCYGQGLPKQVSETEFSIGKSIVIHSDILKENRQLNVYLPLSYTEDDAKQYPVIYLLDGSKDEDFIHISGLVQFGSFSWINLLPESIVVGIGNVDRQRDYTYPSQNKKEQEDFPTSGQSADFIAFLENELQPFVNDHFRTASTQTLIGQSLGGLLATEILFKKPALFDNYIIVSPSLWWDNENLLDLAPAAIDSPKQIVVAGGKEGEVMERTARELFSKLEELNNQNTTLYYDFLENKTHGDVLHIAVYHAFEKLFQKETE